MKAFESDFGPIGARLYCGADWPASECRGSESGATHKLPNELKCILGGTSRYSGELERTNPKDRISAGGAKKAERRREQGAAEAKRAQENRGQKSEIDPHRDSNHKLATAASSCFQSHVR